MSAFPCLAAPVERRADGEAVQCSRLMFKEDFLSEQYFGENQPVSIITEKVHFGEGMHRRAFRTKLHGGQIPLLVPGHCCVLKVHNSISYGTKNSEELIQKNFSLAVEVPTRLWFYSFTVPVEIRVPCYMKHTFSTTNYKKKQRKSNNTATVLTSIFMIGTAFQHF